MSRLGPQTRYGVPIIKMEHGTWFWCHALEDVNFVPAGKRTSSLQKHFRFARQNTLAGALRLALETQRDLIIKDDPRGWGEVHDLPTLQGDQAHPVQGSDLV